MRKNKLKDGIGLTFLSFVSFLTVYGSNSVIYAQSSSPNSVLNTTGDSTPLLVFSLGLLLIVFFMVLVLFFNREHGKEAITGLGLVFLQSMAMYYWASSGQAEAAKSIFETCKTVIPPIITLVLGYYFGKSDQHQSQNNTNNKKNEQDSKAEEK
jgi:uncharacterized membrane protein